MDKKNKKVIKETEKQETDVIVIPINEGLKLKVTNFVESIISVISAGKMEPDHVIVISRTIKEVLDEIFVFMPGTEDLSEAKSNIIKNYTIGGIIDAILLFVQELQNNKIMFDNRQVIVNAIRGEMIKRNHDSQKFLITDIDSLLNDDISAYTDDPIILKAYDKFMKKFKKYGK